jgi:hypothetical protein
MRARLLVAQRPRGAGADTFVVPLGLDVATDGSAIASAILVFAPDHADGGALRLAGAALPATPTGGSQELARRVTELVDPRPRVLVDGRVIPLKAHVALEDRATSRVFVTYRGSLGRLAPGEVAALVFGDEPDEPASIRETGHIAAAVEGGHTVDLDSAELAAARLSSTGPKRTSLAFEEYVRLAALLMEPTTDRGAVLVARGLTEDRWLVEETAWLGRMGNEAMDGDTSLALLYGELLTRERALLARPDEDRTLAEYARARAELERTSDPSRVLAEHRLSIPAFFRLDARWDAEAERDARVRAELERLLAAEHARLDAVEADT